MRNAKMYDNRKGPMKQKSMKRKIRKSGGSGFCSGASRKKRSPVSFNGFFQAFSKLETMLALAKAMSKR